MALWFCGPCWDVGMDYCMSSTGSSELPGLQMTALLWKAVGIRKWDLDGGNGSMEKSPGYFCQIFTHSQEKTNGPSRCGFWVFLFIMSQQYILLYLYPCLFLFPPCLLCRCLIYPALREGHCKEHSFQLSKWLMFETVWPTTLDIRTNTSHILSFSLPLTWANHLQNQPYI